MSNSAAGRQPLFIHDGLPFIPTASTPRDFDPYSHTSEELDQLLREAFVSKVEIFNLSKADELAKYQLIQQAVANGQLTIQREDVRWVETERTWHVLIACRSVYLTR